MYSLMTKDKMDQWLMANVGTTDVTSLVTALLRAAERTARPHELAVAHAVSANQARRGRR
jgi:hypothetical protein